MHWKFDRRFWGSDTIHNYALNYLTAYYLIRWNENYLSRHHVLSLTLTVEDHRSLQDRISVFAPDWKPTILPSWEYTYNDVFFFRYQRHRERTLEWKIPLEILLLRNGWRSCRAALDEPRETAGNQFLRWAANHVQRFCSRWASLFSKNKLLIGRDENKYIQSAMNTTFSLLTSSFCPPGGLYLDEVVSVSFFPRNLSRPGVINVSLTETLVFPCADKLVYIYTSGTTGLPKAAIIKNSRFISMTSITNSIMPAKSSDVFYTCLPLYHTAGGIVSVGQAILFGECGTTLNCTIWLDG